MNTLQLIGRTRNHFEADVCAAEQTLTAAVRGARVLVYGGAGSIGKEVVRQIFQRGPSALHVIDISENNLAELVRDLRSSAGYIAGETRFLPLDMSGVEARAFLASEKRYDFVLNLAAMKHVRSEKDAYSLMRMIKVNVLDTLESLTTATKSDSGRYFAVSTDKAKNPANLMGATKRIAEDILFRSEGPPVVSTARFANVAFSDGSLLHGFRQRVMLQQPISAPSDIRRYFVTGEEAGLLCLTSFVLGDHRDIFFPKLDAGTHLLTFAEIAVRFLEDNGYEPVEVASEAEARRKSGELIAQRKWPVYFFSSDTSGEKPFEEFYSSTDVIDWDRFTDIGVIKAPALSEAERESVAAFLSSIEEIRRRGRWTKDLLVALLHQARPDLAHIETGRFLDEKM